MLGNLSTLYGAFNVVVPEFTAKLGVEVRDQNNARTTETTVTVTDAEGVEVVGDFNEYGQWLSSEELAEGTYTITLVTPEGTVAVINDTVSTQVAVASAEDNVFTIELNEETLGNLSAVYGAFALVDEDADKDALEVLTADETFNGEADYNLSTNGDLETLEEVVIIVNGERIVLTPDQYTAVSGSTIITIPAEVLNELGLTEGDTFEVEVTQSEGAEHEAGTVTTGPVDVVAAEVTEPTTEETTEPTTEVATEPTTEVTTEVTTENTIEVTTEPTTEGTTPEGTTPEGTTPEGTTPEGTTPEGTTPEGTTPEGTTPEGTTPEGTTPEGTTPEGTTPEGTTPEGTTPEGTTVPSEESTDATTTGEDVTQTGESSAPIMFAVLALIVAAGLVVISVRRRRRDS